jgi:hypothetical protein
MNTPPPLPTSPKKFNFTVWSFSSCVAGLLLAGGMGLAEGSNLWPLGAIWGGLAGLIIGVIFGVILKLIKAPMKYAWCFLGVLVFLAFFMRIYIKYYHISDYGKLVEASIVECKTSSFLFTPPWRNGEERKEINGTDLTLNVTRERKLGKYEDGRIKVYEWRLADYQKTYFMEEAKCETMTPGKVIFMRTRDHDLDYEYVHRIHWNENTISRDGRFIIDR